MIIKDSYTSKRTGLTQDISYEEMFDFESIRDLPIRAAGAFCFYKDKLVLVYAKRRDSWEIPGGGRENGETFEESITREIKEESNMRVIDLFPLGLDTYTSRETQETGYVLRYAARVEPIGDFIQDTAADAEITKIKLIDPLDYKQYFDWGERGEVMLKKACVSVGLGILN